MEEMTIQEKLEQFECARCNQCCRQPGYVYLDLSEAEALASLLGLSTFDFVNRHCELLNRQQLVLKKNEDESCIFLTQEGCSVHAAKPRQCREFPVRWRTAASFDYCEGLKKLFPKRVPS